MTSPSTSPTTGAGDLLRRAREERGETLLQVSQGTRISEGYLSALEADASLDTFPAPAYARAFVRAYARHLELDEEEVLAAFVTRHGTDDPPPQAVVGLEEPPPKRWAALPTRLPIRPPQVGGAWSPGRALKSARAVAARARGRRRTRDLSGRAVPVAVMPGAQPRTRGRRSRTLAFGAGLTAMAMVAVAFATGLISLRSEPTPAPVATPSPTPPPLELPPGGRTIFPDYRVVAFYGAARTDRLGILGIGPDLALEKLLKQAKPYETPERPVLPAFELIATVAASSPGEDGKYRLRQNLALVDGYLNAARRAGILLVLDVQPGRADFMTEVKVYERYLKEPDVGLALDPEWHVGPGEVPGQTVGAVDAKTINRVGDYLARIVREHRLPQKLFIIHQFTEDMVKNKRNVKTWPELAVTFDVDGFGSQQNKLSKYAVFTYGYEQRFFHGIKLYYRQDVDLMTPSEVLRLEPEPDMIVYQ